jgi:DNA invertase Pin-like site-specific DNA recombinase
MTGKIVGYVRVSTVDQNPERQLDGIFLHKKFTEYASGSTIKRPQLETMMDYVREDDKIVVHSMDRLARSVKDLRQLVDDFIKKGVVVQFIKENLTFSNDNSPMSILLLTLMGAVAEFEREILLERQREGIQLAKRAGKYKGRPKALNSEQLAVLAILADAPKPKTKNQMAREMGVSRFTLYKYLKQVKEKKDE